MLEQRFLRRPKSTAAPPPASSPDRTMIDIHWGKALAEPIKIRHHAVRLAPMVSWITFRPPRGPRRGARLHSQAKVQPRCTSRSIGTLRIPPSRRFLGAAWLAFTLCLAPFAHGQQTAALATRSPDENTVVLPESVPDPLEPFNRARRPFHYLPARRLPLSPNPTKHG